MTEHSIKNHHSECRSFPGPPLLFLDTPTAPQLPPANPSSSLFWRPRHRGSQQAAVICVASRILCAPLPPWYRNESLREGTRWHIFPRNWILSHWRQEHLRGHSVACITPPGLQEHSLPWIPTPTLPSSKMIHHCVSGLNEIRPTALDSREQSAHLEEVYMKHKKQCSHTHKLAVHLSRNTHGRRRTLRRTERNGPGTRDEASTL